MDLTELVEAYLRWVERRQLARLEAELWKFAEALDQWLYALVLNPRPDWREELDKFLAREAEAGRVAMPEGRQSIIEYLEHWEKKIGLVESGEATGEQGKRGTGGQEPADSQEPPMGSSSAEPTQRGGAASEAYVEAFGPLLGLLEAEIAMRPGEAARLPEIVPRPLEIQPPRVVEVKVLKGIWGHYDELLATGKYEPYAVTRGFWSFVRQFTPGSEPTTRITFDDGTVLILLGGGPDSGALAGQATFLLGAHGAVQSSASLRQAVTALFGHLGREAAESVADEVIQQTTGLPVGPSGLRKPKSAGKVKSGTIPGALTRPKLRRPKLRQETRDAIEAAAEKTPEGKFIDPNTREVIEGEFDYGHVPGREHRRLVAQAEEKGMTQEEFNEWVNSHPEWFRIEAPKPNRSHRFEKPGMD